MRFTCRSCQRVFHIDSTDATPCPYCGGVLEKEQDLFEDAPPETLFASSEDLSLGGWPGGPPAAAEAGGPPRPQAEAPSEAVTAPYQPQPPGRPLGAPSPTSMITTGVDSGASPESYLTQPGPPSPVPAGREVAAAPGPPGAGPPPAEHETPPALDRMVKTAPNLFRTAPAAARAPGRPAAAKAPARTRRGGWTAAAATVAAVLGLAAGAGAMFFWLRRTSFGADAEKTRRTEERTVEIDKTLSALKGQRNELLAEKKRLLEEKRALAEEMKGLKAQLEAPREAPPRSSKAVELVLGAVELLERRADLKRALEMASAAARDDAALVSAHRVKGRVLAAFGRAEDALAAFEAASEAAKRAASSGQGRGPERAGAPGDVESLVLAGEHCLTHLVDRERAAGYYASAAGLGVDSALALVAKARLRQLERKRRDAVMKAQKAAKADPTLALAPLVTGEIALELALDRRGPERERLLEKAGQFLKKAVKLDPNSARACLMRGRMLVEESKLKGVAGSGDAGFGLARFERQDEAARLLQRAKDLSPDLAEAYLALADLRLNKGALRDPAVAVRLAEDAVRLTGRKDARALVTLAAARAATGNPSDAASAVEEALKLAPMNGALRPVLEKYKAEARAVKP